jgi:hypothetical protein
MSEEQHYPQASVEPTQPSKHLHQDDGIANDAALPAALPSADGVHAAQLQQHAQPPEAVPDVEAASSDTQQQQEPPQDPREAAISMLRGIGVSDDRAAEAVDQTRDVFVSIDAAA